MSGRLNRALSWIAAIMMGAVLTAFPLGSQAAEFLELPDGSKADLSQKCPVCGMEIGGKDQQGVTLTFKDGRVVGFDGARCLFIYNSIPQKYNVNVADIAHQYVTDYASKKMIELPKAFLVLGSEVKGPMGYELIAFNNMEEAAKFASENDGKWIVQLNEIARAARERSDNSAATEENQALSPEAKKQTTPILEPNTIPQQKQPAERQQRRGVPQRREQLDPYDASPGGYGHHGGGHMH